MTSRTIIYFICAIVFIILTASIVFISTFWMSKRNLTSHHASINIDMSIYGSTEERISEFENIISTMKEWAKESDMHLVENNETVNLSSFTTDPDAEIREYCFKDNLSSDGPMPLQVMISYNVNGSLQKVRIMFAEGYSKEPSSRLQKISSDLYSRLEGHKVTYNIW